MLLTIRRLQPVLLFILLFGGFTFTGRALYAQDQSLVWQRFDVDLVLNVDGTFAVVEQQTIDFTSGTFRFGYREIPINNLDYIDQWSVTDASGNRYELVNGTDEPYTFTVDENGNSYVIRWYFPALANATETYILGYTVHGALRYYEKGDQLWWKAIYGDRGFPVLASTINVNLPAGATATEWAAYVNNEDAQAYATATVSDERRQVAFALTRRLSADEEFEVRVQFPPGVVAGTAAPWQQSADEVTAAQEAAAARRQLWGPWATLVLGALGLLLLFGGPAALYLLWYRVGRDKPTELVADYLPEPPDELTPGLVGTLLDETADMQDVIATLVDLARRQVISITEAREESLFRMSTDFIYRRERSDVVLLPYEQKLLDGIFGNQDEVRLSDLKNKFYAKVPAIQSAIYQAVTAAGLFPQNPNNVRQLYVVFGVVALIGAFVIGAVLTALFGDLTNIAFLPGVGLGVTAVGLLILSQRMPRKTPHGAEVAARWRAFKRYLQNIDQYADLAVQKEIWDRWLPYAIAFDIDKEYIRKFESVNAPAPGWYIPSPADYGPYRRRYYGTPWVGGPIGGAVGDSGSSGNGGASKGEGGGSIGGGLGDASRGMGTSLASMSAGLGALLTSASTTMTSRPASASSSGGGWSGGGGGFSGGGGGGGGGGSGGFG